MNPLSIEFVFEFVKSGKIELKSTHERLCFPIINRLYRKMKIGVKFSGIRVDGELIIDGHHRYLASLLAGVSLEMYPSIKTSATKIIEWNNVDFVKDDWDTEVKILLMNKIDAEYNGMSLEKLNELLT